jgi:hypothetical protein
MGVIALPLGGGIVFGLAMFHVLIRERLGI